MSKTATPKKVATKKKGSAPKVARRPIGRGRTPTVKAKPKESTTIPIPASEAPAVYAANPTETVEFGNDVALQINISLRQTIEEMVEAAHAAGDYTYISVSAFYREALRDHMKDPTLLAQARKGEKKKRTSMRVDDELFAYWQTFPVGKRSEMFERILLTKIVKMGGQG